HSDQRRSKAMEDSRVVDAEHLLQRSRGIRGLSDQKRKRSSAGPGISQRQWSAAARSDSLRAGDRNGIAIQALKRIGLHVAAGVDAEDLVGAGRTIAILHQRATFADDDHARRGAVVGKVGGRGIGITGVDLPLNSDLPASRCSCNSHHTSGGIFRRAYPGSEPSNTGATTVVGVRPAGNANGKSSGIQLIAEYRYRR